MTDLGPVWMYIPDTGLVCDLLWADPDKEIIGWGENERGVSFTFGEDIVQSFLKRPDLDLICRAHQVRMLVLGRLLRLMVSSVFFLTMYAHTGCRRWLRIFC